MNKDEIKKYNDHLEKLIDFLNSISDDNIYKNINFYNSFPIDYLISPDFINKYDFHKNVLNFGNVFKSYEYGMHGSRSGESSSTISTKLTIDEIEKYGELIWMFGRVVNNEISINSNLLKDIKTINNYTELYISIYKKMTEKSINLVSSYNTSLFLSSAEILLRHVFNSISSDIDNIFNDDAIKECLNCLEKIKKESVFYATSNVGNSLYNLFLNAFRKKDLFDKFKDYDFSQFNYILSAYSNDFNVLKAYKESVFYSLENNKIVKSSVENLITSLPDITADDVYKFFDNLINSKQSKTAKTNKVTMFLLKTFFKFEKNSQAVPKKYEDILENMVLKYHDYIDINKLVKIPSMKRFGDYYYANVLKYYLIVVRELQNIDLNKFLYLAKEFLINTKYIGRYNDDVFYTVEKYTKIEYFDNTEYFNVFTSFLFANFSDRSELVSDIISKRINIDFLFHKSIFGMSYTVKMMTNMISKLDVSIIKKIFQNCTIILDTSVFGKGIDGVKQLQSMVSSFIRLFKDLDRKYNLNFIWDWCSSYIFLISSSCFKEICDETDETDMLYLWNKIIRNYSFIPLCVIFKEKPEQWNEMRMKYSEQITTLFGLYNKIKDKITDFAIDDDFYAELSTIALAQTLGQ